MPLVVERSDLLGREGATEQEALAVTAAMVYEKASLEFSFNSFGERLEAERVRELDD